MLLQHPLVALLQAGVTSNLPEIVTQVILKMSCHSSFLSSSVLRFSIQEWFFNEMRGWVTVTWVHTHCSPGPCGCLQLWQYLPPFGAQLFALGPHWSEALPLPWHSSASDSSSVRPDSCPAAAAQHLCSPVPGQEHAGIAAEEYTEHLRLFLWILCKMKGSCRFFWCFK